MSSQRQNVGERALAVQSGRDTNIANGLNADDLQKILQTIAEQTSSYAAIAREIADQRIQDFAHRLVQQFAPGQRARIEAFSEPDFQAVVALAQNVHARAGDDTVRDTLIDLIALRSQEKGRTRLRISLNEAISVSGNLTANEFASLSFVYLLRHTQTYTGDRDQLSETLNSLLSPLLPDITRSDSSYQHLESQSVAKIGVGDFLMQGDSFSKVVGQTYCRALSTGFEIKELQRFLPDGKKEMLDRFLEPMPDLPGLYRFQQNGRGEIFGEVLKEGLAIEQARKVVDFVQTKTLSGKALVDVLSKHMPQAELAADLWNKTMLSQLELTSVGMAIAHSNLTRVTPFKADLAGWIV